MQVRAVVALLGFFAEGVQSDDDGVADNAFIPAMYHRLPGPETQSVL